MLLHRALLNGILLILLSAATLSLSSSASADCADPGECFCLPVEGAAALHVRVVASESGQNPRLTLEIIERLSQDDTQLLPDQFEAGLTPLTCGVETDVSVGRELLAFVQRSSAPCGASDLTCVAEGGPPTFEVSPLAWGTTFTPDDMHSFDVADVASLRDRLECQRAFSDVARSCDDTYDGCTVFGAGNPSLPAWIALGALAWLRRRPWTTLWSARF